MMADSVKPSECAGCGRSRGFFALVAVLLLGRISANGGETPLNAKQHAGDPHEDMTMCSACHTSEMGGQGTLIFGNDITQLCQSCHDGRQATREVHPLNLAPGAAMAGTIPSDFPLEQGKLACSTCHNIEWSCPEEQPAAMPNRNFLRGAPTPHALAFCFNCHIQASYKPFNVHDQLDAGRRKTDTCLWCHLSVPEVGSNVKEAAAYGLRGKAVDLCGNCHSMPAGHPTGDPHMYSTPTAEMTSYMSAYEIQNKMRLPLKELLAYVKAAKRPPRFIPLDEDGRITCYSCHNPHERGLLRNWNPRSIGAEPKKAKNHRLRVHQGDIACRACHQK
jgi:predicted CXXCH cytochrome family protein